MARVDIDVRLVTLDEIVEQVGVRPPRFIKIDVEGAEPAVLLGARRLLEGRTAGVTLTAWEHMPKCREILLEHGYSIVEGGDCEIFALPPGWDGPQPDRPRPRRRRQMKDRP